MSRPTMFKLDSTCFGLDILGIEGSNANGTICCPLACVQCGGTGCSSSGAAAGLNKFQCCISDVLDSAVVCGVDTEAPCIMNGKPYPVRFDY